MTRQRPKSIVLVNTGDGKGRTSAAIGMAVRGVARGWRVGVIQFIESGKWKTGEARLAAKLDVDWWSLDDDFTWESEDLETDSKLGREAWALAAKLIAYGGHQLIILNEFTYAMTFRWIPTAGVIEAITNRPARVNVVLTGRDAPDEIIEIDDTVTEIRNIKHAFDQGISAMKGIDF